MSQHNFRVYVRETALGWRVSRWCSFAQGESRVSTGAWVRVYDELGHHVGYQPRESRGPDADVIASAASRGAITARESMLNAGACFRGGASRTARLPEQMRLGRVHPLSGRPLPAEDSVERVQGKVAAWREVAGREAVLAGRVAV